MNRTETLKIMAVLQAAYPQFYAKKGPDEIAGIVNLWTEMFAEDTYMTVAMATKALIKTRISTYPPGIGEITEKIMQITQPEEMTEQEAWALVMNATRNSAYNSSDEFAKLPTTVQKIIGSPAQLRDWAMMDSDQVNSVVASNFQRSYRARAKSEREYIALPQSVKQYVEALSAGMEMKRLDSAQRGAGVTSEHRALTAGE